MEDRILTDVTGKLLCVAGAVLLAFGPSGCAQRRTTSTEPVDPATVAVQKAEALTKAKPDDPMAWANLVNARYAAATRDIDPGTQEFGPEGMKLLPGVVEAWNRHRALASGVRGGPDVRAAASAVQALVALDRPREAADAQKVVADASPTSQAYARLAMLRYAAGEIAEGDAARAVALSLTSRDFRPALREQLDQSRSTAPGR